MVLFSRNANTKTTTNDNDLLYNNNSNNNTSDKQRIAAALLEIEKRQGSSKTFTLPISNNNNNNNINEEEYMKHFYSNTVFEKANEMKSLLYKYPDTLGEHYKNLVPNTVSFGLFWGRYYYKCNVETIMNEWMYNELQFIKDQNQSTMMIMQTIQGKYHHKENNNYNNNNNIIDDDNTITNHQSSVQSSFNSISTGEYEKMNTSSLPMTLPTSSTMTTNPLLKQKSFSRIFSSSFSSYRNKSTSLITNPVDTKDADASIAKTVVDGTAVTTNHTTTDPNNNKNTIENNNNKNNNIDSSTIPESDPYYMAIFHLLGNTTAKLDVCEPSNTELDNYDDDVYDDNDNDRYNQVSNNNTNKINKKSNAQSPTRKSNTSTTPLSTPSKKKRTPSKKEQELMEEEKRIAECLQV